MHTALLDYTDDNLTCEAFVVCDDTADAARPCVLDLPPLHHAAASASISRDASTPVIRARGQRAASSRVTFPVPAPRS